MRSNLTRVVLRRIAYNQPIIFRDCIYRSQQTRQLPQHVCHKSPVQRRTLFNWMRRKPREIKPAEVDPGLLKMDELTRALLFGHRKPPSEELVTAWRELFEFKTQNGLPVEDYQVQLAMRTFNYLLAAPSTKDSQPWLSNSDLSLALSGLCNVPKDSFDDHRVFARLLFETIEARETQEQDTQASRQKKSVSDERVTMIQVLTRLGSSEEALKLVEKYQKDDDISQEDVAKNFKSGDPRDTKWMINRFRAWHYLLRGFAHEKDEDNLLYAAELMKQHGVPFTGVHQHVLVRFYAGRDDIDKTRFWFEHPLWANRDSRQSLKSSKWRWDGEVSQSTLNFVLQLCIRKNLRSWGQSIVRSALEHHGALPKQSLDTFLIWAAFSGQGVEGVERMIDVAQQQNPQWRADSDSINGLVEYAMDRDDAYLAERFINLGERRGIPPSASTHALQMKYRLRLNDIEGALTAYGRLQAEELNDTVGVLETNQLIQAMCASQRYEFNSIIPIVEDFNRRRVRFEPDTVSVLALLHISRDELHDAIDLLQTHALRFSIPQRARIIVDFVAFCLDSKTSTTRAWDTYTILSHEFSEIDRGIRMKIMDSFFGRRRPDMAVHVFNAMQGSSRADIVADADTYVAVLEGLARSASTISLQSGALSEIINRDTYGEDADTSADVEGFGEGGAFGEADNELETLLTSVYSHLKLDPNVPLPPTRLLTALMTVYTALGKSRRALEFWHQIASSKEGPTWKSIHAALRACEHSPWGDEEARKIWRRLRRMDVDIGKDMWASYIAALTGNGFLDEVEQTLEAYTAETGEQPDVFMLGSMYNAAQIGAHSTVAQLIRTKYPKVGEELQRTPTVVNNHGWRVYDIDRQMSSS
ncbi:MAG: hypothetical protein M1820_008215 [Bogoriella megaspora]|nr:MAG: hypothetical protein M1820_008215 [Bogoriella megaspora]